MQSINILAHALNLKDICPSYFFERNPQNYYGSSNYLAFGDLGSSFHMKVE
jgi:hypothetical protein